MWQPKEFFHSTGASLPGGHEPSYQLDGRLPATGRIKQVSEPKTCLGKLLLDNGERPFCVRVPYPLRLKALGPAA